MKTLRPRNNLFFFSPMDIQAIFFDLDQTLVDFLRLKRICCDQAVEAMIDAGLDISPKQALKIIYDIYEKFGMEDQEVFQKFLHKVGKNMDYRILSHGIVAYRKAKMSFLNPYPGTKATLMKLKHHGYKLAIVTDAPRMKAWDRLVSMRIDDFFDAVITYDDTKKFKPDKEPFLLAMKTLKVMPQHSLYIGDHPERDIKGAKSVGMKTVLAAWGKRKRNNKLKADYVLNDITDLLKILGH